MRQTVERGVAVLRYMRWSKTGRARAEDPSPPPPPTPPGPAGGFAHLLTVAPEPLLLPPVLLLAAAAWEPAHREPIAAALRRLSEWAELPMVVQAGRAVARVWEWMDAGAEEAAWHWEGAVAMAAMAAAGWSGGGGGGGGSGGDGDEKMDG